MLTVALGTVRRLTAFPARWRKRLACGRGDLGGLGERMSLPSELEGEPVVRRCHTRLLACGSAQPHPPVFMVFPCL